MRERERYGLSYHSLSSNCLKGLAHIPPSEYVDEGDGDGGKQGIQEEGVISEMKGGKWEGLRKKGGGREREKGSFMAAR